MEYSKGEALKCITDFVTYNDWESKNIAELTRSFFAMWSHLFDVMPDTRECDLALWDIYEQGFLSLYFDTFNDYENFMLELIV